EEARKNSPRMLSWKQILQRIHAVTEERDNILARIALATAELLLHGAPNDLLQQHLKHLDNEKLQAEQRLRTLKTELQYRPALAFGCLFFVLVGCPVGIWFSRSDYLSAFISCFLPIVVIYYPLMLCGSNFAKEGKLHPLPDVWAANATMGVIALALFRRLLRN